MTKLGHICPTTPFSYSPPHSFSKCPPHLSVTFYVFFYHPLSLTNAVCMSLGNLSKAASMKTDDCTFPRSCSARCGAAGVLLARTAFVDCACLQLVTVANVSSSLQQALRCIVCVSTCMRMYICMNLGTCVHMCVYMCACVSMYVCMCICIHVYVCEF